MSQESKVTVIRSFWWARLIVIVISIGLIGLGLYAWQLVQASNSEANYKVFDRFMFFRDAFMSILPFYLAILLFVLGLWSYSMFVDMNNTFREFNYRPQEALLYVILPVLNIYGIGWTISRIIRVFEHEKLRFEYRPQIQNLKIALTIFYGGLAGFIVSLFFALTIQLNERMFFKQDFLVFNVVEFILIAIIGGGLIWTILQTGVVIKEGLKRKVENE